MSILFSIARAFKYISGRLKDSFWQWYHVHYCMANNVMFNDRRTVRFNSRSVISISPKSNVSIGDAFVLNSGPESGVVGSTPSKIIVKKGAMLSIGNNTGMSSVLIYCSDSIRIGHNVNVGGGTMINDSNHHSTDWHDREDRRRDAQNAQSAPIVIGDLVFIGARCIINKGVTIGEKSVIAAGSVVVKDIPANCIAGGNPCKVIRGIGFND